MLDELISIESATRCCTQTLSKALNHVTELLHKTVVIKPSPDWPMSDVI